MKFKCRHKLHFVSPFISTHNQQRKKYPQSCGPLQTTFNKPNNPDNPLSTCHMLWKWANSGNIRALSNIKHTVPTNNEIEVAQPNELFRIMFWMIMYGTNNAPNTTDIAVAYFKCLKYSNVNVAKMRAYIFMSTLMHASVSIVIPMMASEQSMHPIPSHNVEWYNADVVPTRIIMYTVIVVIIGILPSNCHK